MKRAITNQSHENKKQIDCELHRVPLKTQNENEMKTNSKSFRRNNVKKTILRSAAVIVSFILISFTVSAQTFWFRLLENTGFKDIVMVMTSQTKDGEMTATTLTTEAIEYYTVDIEPALEVEDWMMDISKVDINQLDYEELTEPGMKVEDWMVSNKSWGF